MHIEVQVALNFVISYLYNKLPRRRVNIFGEELEKALKEKFRGHWYPEKPFKGSAFRCMKTGDPVDPVFEIAARESGVPIQDILENLPTELAVWVDPGEVSYRIGEKNVVKILYSENGDPQDDNSADREVTKTFNPEAQCFQPIDAVTNNLNGLNISPKSSMSQINGNVNVSGSTVFSGNLSSSSSTSSPTSANGSSTFKNSPSPIMSFLPRSTTPLTFTTAAFAQTKFGSTKLKTSSKRTNRMSPTEFSNYIRQKAIQQQMHHHNNHQQPPQHLYNNGLNGQTQPMPMLKNQMHKTTPAATVVATNLASRSMSPYHQSQHPHNNHIHAPHHHQVHGNQTHHSHSHPHSHQHHANLSNGLKTNNYDSPYFFPYPQANTSTPNYSANLKNVFDTAIPSSSSNSTFFSAPEFYNQSAAPNHHYHNQQQQPPHHPPHQQQNHHSFNANSRLSRSFFDPNLSFSLNGIVAANGISNESTLINSTETTDNNNNTDKLLEGYNMNTYKQLLLAN